MNNIYIANDEGYMFTGFYDKNGKMIYHYDTLVYEADGERIKSKVAFYAGCFFLQWTAII